MPALPPAPSVLRIQFEYNTGGSLRAGNRVYYEYSGGPPSAPNLDTLATDVSSAFSTDLAEQMSQSFSLVEVAIEDLTSSSAAVGSWTGSVEGTRSDATPDNTLNDALIQNFQISRRYRGGRPKTFWPFGVSGDRATDATWGAGFITSCTTQLTAFDTALKALTGVGCTLVNRVNVSFYEGFASVQNPVTKRWTNIPTPRSGDAVIDVINTFSINPLIGSQRRRRTSTSR
jgi:hypothetical protein